MHMNIHQDPWTSDAHPCSMNMPFQSYPCIDGLCQYAHILLLILEYDFQLDKTGYHLQNLCPRTQYFHKLLQLRVEEKYYLFEKKVSLFIGLLLKSFYLKIP